MIADRHGDAGTADRCPASHRRAAIPRGGLTLGTAIDADRGPKVTAKRNGTTNAFLMRVLTIANCVPRSSDGSGYVVTNYVRELRRNGIELDLLDSAAIDPLPELRRGIQYKLALGMAIQTVAALRRARYDLVEFYGSECWLAAAVLGGMAQRPVLVLHSNGLEPHAIELLIRAGLLSPAKNRLSQVLAERAVRCVDYVVTVGQFDTAWAIQQGLRNDGSVLALDNPLPDTYLEQAVDLERPKRVAFVGTWIPRKGISVLRRDMPVFLRAHPDWRLLLVGVGTALSLEDVFPADVCGQIDVVPYAERETELRHLYHSVAIVVNPSVYESFGLSAAEGCACGCALVATPVGFAASLEDGKDAVLLHPSDADHPLAEALTALAANDPLRRRLAYNGYRRTQTLRWSTAGRQLANAYRAWADRQPSYRAELANPPTTEAR